MVKVNAPAMSLDASGSLAGTMVFSKWKGRNYVRQLVRPANPKLPKQVSVRAMFKFLSQQWKPNISAVHQATWDKRADAAIVSPFNAYMGHNQTRWRGMLAPGMADPVDETGTLPTVTAFTATGGIRMVTLDWTVNPHANGWGILIFRSTDDGFTPTFDNLIAVGLANATDSFTFIDTPLIADTYYYNLRTFSLHGNQSGNWGEVNAAAT